MKRDTCALPLLLLGWVCTLYIPSCWAFHTARHVCLKYLSVEFFSQLFAHRTEYSTLHVPFFVLTWKSVCSFPGLISSGNTFVARTDALYANINLIENSTFRFISFHSIAYVHVCEKTVGCTIWLINRIVDMVHIHIQNATQNSYASFNSFHILRNRIDKPESHTDSLSDTNTIEYIKCVEFFFLHKVSYLHGCTILKRHKINNTDMSELYVMDFMFSLQRTRKRSGRRREITAMYICIFACVHIIAQSTCEKGSVCGVKTCLRAFR